MADEYDSNRSFKQLTSEEITPSRVANETNAPTKGPASRGMPKARVNPELAQEYDKELVEKVISGRKRMFWFANHFILFVLGVGLSIALKFSIYQDLESEYFLVGHGVWVGVLAVHARFALAPIFRRSDKESQLKAIIPDALESGNGDSD